MQLFFGGAALDVTIAVIHPRGYLSERRLSVQLGPAAALRSGHGSVGSVTSIFFVVSNQTDPALSIVPRVNWLEGVVLAGELYDIGRSGSAAKDKGSSPIRTWSLPFLEKRRIYSTEKEGR
jgi:hypothetical protein